MNNDLMNKIINILEVYEDPIFSAKLWNIDTNIFNFLNIVSKILQDSKKYKFKEIRVQHFSEENRYKFWIDEILIPSSYDEFLAESTIRQYLQIFTSLNYIDGAILPKMNSYIILELFFEISNLLFLEPISFTTKIIINSIKSNVSYIKNIGFSMFVCCWRRIRTFWQMNY